MMFQEQAAVIVLVFVTLASQCQGHGFLAEPAGRSSMWRVSKFKSLVEPNYSDMGLRCGGSRSTCGICGDPVDGPFENEAGGRYASGLIAKEYTEGQTIRVTIDVTANHQGWFQFHLCPNNDVTKRATEECLMRNVLQLSTGGTKYYLKDGQYGKTYMHVVLPEGVTCSQCVFRWKWITKITGLEQFYGCSDISISPREGALTTIAPETPKPTAPATEAPPTEAPATEAPATEAPATEAPATEAPATEAPATEAPATEAPATEAPATEAPTKEAPLTEATTPKAPATETPVSNGPWSGKTWKPIVHGVRVRLMCRAVGVWKYNDEMDEWCNNNCNNYQYNCPPSFCECVQRM